MNGLNNRKERTEERSNRMEARTIKTTQLEKHRENRKKNDQRSRAYETITKYLIFLSLDSQMEKTKKVRLKKHLMK